MHRAEEAAGAALDVPLDAGDLPREVDVGARAELHLLVEEPGASTKVFRWTLPKRRNSRSSRPGIIRKTRDLLAVRHPRLEADEVVRGRGRVLLAELHDGEGAAPGRGSVRPTGFIGPKASVISPRAAMTSMGRHPSK